MATIDQKKDMNKKKQEDKDIKEDQIEETLENASDTVIAESKNEATQIGDSDRE
jgi:hypothetical protein